MRNMKTFSYETAESVNKNTTSLHNFLFSLSLIFPGFLRISIFDRFAKFYKIFARTGFAF